MRNSKLAYVCFALWFVQCSSSASDLATAEQCTDGQWDGQETDVDCGGPTCRACDFNKVCRTDGDCKNGHCESIKVCRHPAMTLTAVAPAGGPIPGGTMLTLTGTNFQPGIGISVTVAGVAATNVVVVSPTQLTATTARSTTIGVGDVVVTAPYANTASLAESFDYFLPVVFAAASNSDVGEVYDALAVGDFNGDTKLDLAVSMGNSGNVRVLRGYGGSGFAAATPYFLGARPRSMVVGDFNGDTKIDLVVSPYSFDRVGVVFGNGLGGFTADSISDVGEAPFRMVVGDVKEN